MANQTRVNPLTGVTEYSSNGGISWSGGEIGGSGGSGDGGGTSGGTSGAGAASSATPTDPIADALKGSYRTAESQLQTGYTQASRCCECGFPKRPKYH